MELIKFAFSLPLRFWQSSRKKNIFECLWQQIIAGNHFVSKLQITCWNTLIKMIWVRDVQLGSKSQYSTGNQQNCLWTHHARWQREQQNVVNENLKWITRNKHKVFLEKRETFLAKTATNDARWCQFVVNVLTFLLASINIKVWRCFYESVGLFIEKRRKWNQKDKNSSGRQKLRRWMNLLSSLQSVWWDLYSHKLRTNIT